MITYLPFVWISYQDSHISIKDYKLYNPNYLIVVCKSPLPLFQNYKLRENVYFILTCQLFQARNLIELFLQTSRQCQESCFCVSRKIIFFRSYFKYIWSIQAKSPQATAPWLNITLGPTKITIGLKKIAISPLNYDHGDSYECRQNRTVRVVF